VTIERVRLPVASRSRRVFLQQVRRPDRPALETAAAVRAGAHQFVLDAVGAEGALEAADHGVRGFRRQGFAAAFAVGFQFQHGFTG